MKFQQCFLSVLSVGVSAIFLSNKEAETQEESETFVTRS
jgi:hypothetical protein